MAEQDLDTKVAGIKKRATAAQARQARAEGQAEAAAQRVQAAEETLLREFGIGPEETAQAIASHEDDLAAEAQRVEAALERAETSE